MRYEASVPPGMTAWDHYFMSLAEFVSGKSKDTSTKVGCVIVDDRNTVVSMGWNDHPRGIADAPERRDRPGKYLWTEHAERNAIYNAAALGVSLVGTTAYSTLFPCCDCARALIQSGIKRLVTLQPNLECSHRAATSHHRESWEMLLEAGFDVRIIPRLA